MFLPAETLKDPVFTFERKNGVIIVLEKKYKVNQKS